VEDTLLQIGAVAEVVGLSLRTIRYYEEIGLVTPSGRTTGGFRLYDAEDVDRLLLIKRMKPLGYPLEQMARLLELLDVLDAGRSTATVDEAFEELHAFADSVDDRIDRLTTELAYAEEFRDRMREQLARRSAR
jgi:DNA-binding transcriptional MerR regulator